MIPKIIHYCWFGRNQLDEKSQKCIKTWREVLPEYEIIEWNEDSFDINTHPFVKEAYENKKYAYVSDYVRLYALYNYGGVYMDTDVEVLKPFGSLMEHRAFTGVERGEYCITGTLAAEKGHPWIAALLNYYKDRHFLLPNGQLDMTTNTGIITNITKTKYGWTEGNVYSELSDGIAIYPFEYFCAKNGRTNEYLITENTYTIHHFNGSWNTTSNKIFRNYIRFFRRIFQNKKHKID